jgi:hypothetical protein
MSSAIPAPTPQLDDTGANPMPRPSPARTVRRLTLTAAAGAALLAALPAHAIQAYGLTTTNAVFTFDTMDPLNGSMPMAITGLAAGERIVSIDIRPTTQMLYGVGDAGGVYRIDAMGMATMVGMLDAAPGSAALGIDFNPAADLSGGASLRVITGTGQNYAFNVNNGTNASGEGAIPGGHPSVAYANNDTDPATGTALYYIDVQNDLLKVATGNFNNTMAAPITITTVGALGVDANGISGFDITVGNMAYASFTDADTGKSMLYGINLATGAATAMGSFGFMGNTIVTPPIAGLAISPVPEPETYALMLAGLAAVGAAAKRRRVKG